MVFVSSVSTYATTWVEQDLQIGFFIRGGYPGYVGMNHYAIGGSDRLYTTVRDGTDVAHEL